MKRLLISAFACDPTKGSEAGNGWNYASKLALEGYEVQCFTRSIHKGNIEQYEKPSHLYFHYVSLPFGLEALYSKSQATMYLHYILWQWVTYLKAKKLHAYKPFEIAHHVTWGSLQLGTFLYKLGVPFVFGPAGGGQKAPVAFKEYFGKHWGSEIKREKVSNLLLRFNPGCNQMLKKAKSVLVSNTETWELAKEVGAKHLYMSLDAALPNNFFPDTFLPKKPVQGVLNLLWVGRFMPRKGLPLVLDVMKELKNYTNIRLTVVGDGEMMDSVVQMIKEFGLEKTVELKGKVPFEEVKSFYASHDVFFFTSLRDSGGVQLVEAMAYGMPVVTLNLHGQGMIVNDKIGIKCACETPQVAISALTNALLDLYQHPEKVTEMSHAAYAYAREQTWEAKIRKIIQEHY